MGIISDIAKQKEAAIEKWGVSHCQFCGEILDPKKKTEEVGEFYDPNEADPVLVEMGMNVKTGHAQCGISAGWELA